MIVTVEEADVYFDTRLGASDFWATGTEKEAALQTAEYDLLAAYGTLEETEANQRCVCEQALFRLQNATGYDKRAGLRAQGVTAAGVVKETYDDGAAAIPICPYARQILGSPGGATVHAVEMETDD